ncbi:hypothetical protein BO99DRAFT_239839 [Aspergillus violaceofuscus CBS 115571]|uniref:Uncharacterized protein n=1 Tax=Aspergillus violaceofuscus (strain CBS 115571) TaxID=1450538 RepID=A0A2V5HGF2_ASPV1|nr:hypothetical protein BO99DRAFT_239839 [Aspergillus violaceofuscus CBS 115571]
MGLSRSRGMLMDARGGFWFHIYLYYLALLNRSRGKTGNPRGCGPVAGSGKRILPSATKDQRRSSTSSSARTGPSTSHSGTSSDPWSVWTSSPWFLMREECALSHSRPSSTSAGRIFKSLTDDGWMDIELTIGAAFDHLGRVSHHIVVQDLGSGSSRDSRRGGGADPWQMTKLLQTSFEFITWRGSMRRRVGQKEQGRVDLGMME